MQNVRLKDDEIEAIRQCFSMFFGAGDRLWLFGSRVVLDQKGGDIDLYIETHHSNPGMIIDAKLKFLVALKKKIGDQKIDIVIRHDDLDLPIYRVARSEGVRLI